MGEPPQHPQPPQPPGTQQKRRRWLIVVVIIAVLLLVLSHFNKQSNNAGQTSTAKGSGSPSVVFSSFHVGDCVTWNQYVASAPPRVVPCSTSHIFQVTGSTVMPGGQFPKVDQLSAAVSLGQCHSLAIAWLGGEPYPVGKYNSEGLAPTRQGWAQGDHALWCGVAISVPHSSIWVSSTGSAEGSG